MSDERIPFATSPTQGSAGEFSPVPTPITGIGPQGGGGGNRNLEYDAKTKAWAPAK
jgi:hypothetical protein